MSELMDLHFPDSNTCIILGNVFNYTYWCNNGNWSVSVYDNATQTKSYRTIDAIYSYMENGVSFSRYTNINHEYINADLLAYRRVSDSI